LIFSTSSNSFIRKATAVSEAAVFSVRYLIFRKVCDILLPFRKIHRSERSCAIAAQIMTMKESAAADRKNDHFRLLIFAAIFAALTYVVFTFLSIPIPTPGGGKVTVHLGNAFCVLGALILGSAYGAAGGAIGLTLADLLDPVYITEAPITFAVKFLMGLIVGLLAHKAGKITRKTSHGAVLKWTVLSSAAGLLFNAFCDPAVRYFYKILILGKPAAEVSFAINLGVTAINSVISLVVCVSLYMALRPALKRTGMFFTF